MEDDNDLMDVWALVDSGAGAQSACKAKHYQGATLRKSAAQERGVTFKNSSGGDMPLNGEFAIPTTTDEGHRGEIVFQNLEVEMPIVSVPMLCHHSDVDFKKRGGTIRHRTTGEVSRFIKKSGVYFIKLKVKKALVTNDGNRPCSLGQAEDDDPMSPFGRHGVP